MIKEKIIWEWIPIVIGSGFPEVIAKLKKKYKSGEFPERRAIA